MSNYDIGVVGCWYWGNYGSLLNGYATYSLLRSFNMNVLNIVTPYNGFEPHAKKFFDVAYPKNAISEVLPFERVKEFNDKCDMFLTGSDQIWNDSSRMPFVKYFHLDFANDDKRKISFSTSFGKNINAPEESRGKIISSLMQRYNAISVREDIGVRVCKDYYGVNATQIMEPVLDVDPSVWYELSEHSELPKEKEPYILAYILDPTPEKTHAIKYYSEKSGMKAINIVDGFSARHEINKNKLGLPNTLPNITSYDFLKYFINASYVISDSFHGTAFAIAFNKPFISIANMQRGLSRFETLLGKVGLMSRLVDDKKIPETERFLYHVDFRPVNEIITKERNRASEWLKNALNSSVAETVALPKNIVERLDKNRCMGCGACVSCCPTKALSLKPDEFGYYRSYIDKSKCVNCGLCMEKCAAFRSPHNLNAKTPLSYAFVCKDHDILMNSASGGAFPVLAKTALDRGGIVVGAAWDENNAFFVRHIFVSNKKDISKLQKSKYLQSYLGDTFSAIKKYVDSGRFVLFTGCPCQVAGLKKYLGKSYENLLLVDLLCAVCPSQAFFEKYIHEKFNNEIETFQFRAKSDTDKIWDAYTYKTVDKLGTTKLTRMVDDDYYKNPLLLTPSHCKVCKYQGTTRYGDITIGDCWGVQNYDPNIDVSHGVSAILINNEKGEEFIRNISKSDIGLMVKEPLSEIKKYNVCAFQENRNWPKNPNRDMFYESIVNNNYFDSIRRALKK